METEKERRVNLINETTKTLHFGSQVPGFLRQCLHLQELVVLTGIPLPSPPLPPHTFSPPPPHAGWVTVLHQHKTDLLALTVLPPAADLPPNFHSSFLAFKVVSGP